MEVWGPQTGEVTFGGSPLLSCKRDQIKMRDYEDRRVTSPTWGPPPPCKQAPKAARIESCHNELVFPWVNRRSRSEKSMKKFVYKPKFLTSATSSKTFHFKPLLCVTRLTQLTYSALFSNYNAPGISEIKRSTFHCSTSCIFFKNGDKQKHIKRCK